MKTEVRGVGFNEGISATDMEVGALYEIVEGDYSGAVVVRIYGNVMVDVQNFGLTWSSLRTFTSKVRRLPAGTQVVLTQE